MKIRLKFEKTNLIRLIVAMIFAAVLYYKVTFPVYVLAGFGACYFLIKSLEIEINNKWLKLALNVVLLGGSSVLTAYMVQYLLLDAELRAKITDTKMFLNVLCCLVVYVVVQVFTKNVGLTCVISHIALMTFAGINYFVYLFRGNEFIFSDLRSISTGLSEAVFQLIGGIRSGMGYCGARDIAALQRAQFIRITSNGVTENHPHDVTITSETPNYSRGE